LAAAISLTWLASAPTVSADEPQTDPAHVEFFEKKVRPLLATRCHECHGAKAKKGSLRLDSRAAALAGGDTGAALVPGKPEESLLIDAVRYGDIYQMPPKSQLPEEEIATLVEWVRLGAPWGHETAAAEQGPVQGSSPAEFDLAARAKHWSFQPIQDPKPPATQGAWATTPIDRFILARLEAAGLQPAPPADKRTLIRRLTFDLTGLPPTPQEIDAFLADEQGGAYERLVDRLLASPRYGERWARHWLDLVRFAETYGHEFDFEIPNAYRYRDYLIRAFNDDVPYDQLVLEHIAGDLLPKPRRHPDDGGNQSIVATGCFLFGEGKHSPVDVRQEEADRIDNQIDVFAKAFLGLTVSCARCHDHKFDAITTKDYYALAGYLQSSRYQQAYIDNPARCRDQLTALEALHAEQQAALTAHARSSATAALAQLPKVLLANPSTIGGDWTKVLNETARNNVDHPLHAWALLAQSAKFADSFPTARDELSARWDAQRKATQSATFADFCGTDFGEWIPSGDAFGARPAHAGEVGPSLSDELVLTRPTAHSGRLSQKLQGALRSPTFEITAPKIFYRLHGNGGKVRLIVDGLQLIRNPIYGGLEFGPDNRPSHWHTQDVSKWVGHRAYIELLDDGDGYVALEQVAFGAADAPSAQPNRIVAELLKDASLTTGEPFAAALQSRFTQVFAAWMQEAQQPGPDAADRGAIVNLLLNAPWVDAANRQSAREQYTAQCKSFDERRQQIEAKITSPRQALALADGTAENEHVFIRGNPKTLGDEVPRRLLEVLGGTEHAPPSQGSGRLQLAWQLIAPDNPLVARVVVNRLWHHHFGAGLVRTVDDFGVMGQPPTHPALLDYLARELMREGWSLKRLHRQIVLSNSYRMASQADPEADRADPLNALWHRREVRRLDAEAVRDAVLAVSGRLDEAMYGPGVMPYLTPYMSGRGRPANSGPLDGNGRRSIYLAVRRNFLSPMLQAFDYPTPFTTIGRRGVSNVPAQALTMMNNPFVVEQARHWAERVLAEPHATSAARVQSMYLAAFGRPADEQELHDALAFVDVRPAAAELSGEGAANPAASSPADELQTWADFAHVLVNLKEFIFIP
jgi:mono/diheme cytochrome c family protein